MPCQMISYLYDHSSGDNEVVGKAGHPTGHQDTRRDTNGPPPHTTDGRTDGGETFVLISLEQRRDTFTRPPTSPRQLARTNETKRFPGWGRSALTPPTSILSLHPLVGVEVDSSPNKATLASYLNDCIRELLTKMFLHFKSLVQVQHHPAVAGGEHGDPAATCAVRVPLSVRTQVLHRARIRL